MNLVLDESLVPLVDAEVEPENEKGYHQADLEHEYPPRPIWTLIFSRL